MKTDPKLIAAGNAEADAADNVEALLLVIHLAVDVKMVFVAQFQCLRQCQANACTGETSTVSPRMRRRSGNVTLAEHCSERG